LYDGKGTNQREEFSERRKNVMSKKVQTIFAILIVSLALGGYWYYTHRAALIKMGKYMPELPARSTPPGGTAASPAATMKELPGNSVKKDVGAVNLPILRSGESLEYAANISKLNSTIANIRLVVGQQQSVEGKPAWHLQAFAHTENPYRMVFELDDQFDSYSEPGALTSLQYEMHLNERGQKVDSIQRLLSSTKEPVPEDEMAVRVLPGTRDPLGMLNYLRGTDWSKTTEVRSPVYDGRKLYDVRAILQSRYEAVAVPAGKFNASKIEIHVIDNGTEMKDTHFLLYLSNDATRTPVLMEAVLPIATARVELTKVN
jgi:hypothetical protein